MCEFCIKHGEGKKWYLNAKNYSQELYIKLKVEKFAREFIEDFEKWLVLSLNRLDRLNSYPRAIQNIAKGFSIIYQKKVHYGQVVPIEDIEKILNLIDTVIRFTCICRKVSAGKERRDCIGISINANKGLKELVEYPDYSKEFEVLDKESAIKLFREFEEKGLYHSVWTFKTPFIAGICNCDSRNCLSYRARTVMKLPVFFKAEYVANIDLQRCKGCRNCQKFCQFGAVSYSLSYKKCFVNKKICYGCGICGVVCKEGALKLLDRGHDKNYYR